MTADTLHWILLILVVINLLGTGAILFRRYPPA